MGYIMLSNADNDISDYNLFFERMIGCETYAVD